MPKGKGRANGEGTIYEYPKDSGIWYAQISLDDGSRRKRRAASQREAREKLRQLVAELERGVDLAAQQPTVAQWCQTWLEAFAINLKPNIKEDYAAVIRRYIADALVGRRRLSQLTPADVQAWVNALSARVAPQTVRNAHARLHKALVVAVRQRYIARNVTDDIELPSGRPPPIKPLNFEQACALLAAVAGHRLAALYRLAINLGMRQGELLGLTWDALDLDAGTIRVDRQLRRVRNGKETREFVLQTTKTKAGERVLQLDEDLMAVLREHRREQQEEAALREKQWKNGLNLVFVTETGAPLHISDLTKHFKNALKRAGLPIIRFHDLRHTAATLMLANGVSLVTVSKILGHSSPAITATIYAHALDESKASAIAELSERLRKK
ncbi:MAG TPA: tyrosine-type recombinase/integrase [Roseiflexaceae bacterium]|jgi:integrase